MTPVFEIVKVTIQDIAQLQTISRQTFIEAFWETNDAGYMNQYMDKSFSLEILGSEVQNNNSEFYFAKLDERVVGYLKLNTGQAQTDIKDGDALEIERIYVVKDFYGKAVGQLLIDFAVSCALKMQSKYIWLGVWEDNPRAIRFYEKNGFVAFGSHAFWLGDDKQTDVLMKRLV